MIDYPCQLCGALGVVDISPHDKIGKVWVRRKGYKPEYRCMSFWKKGFCDDKNGDIQRAQIQDRDKQAS